MKVLFDSQIFDLQQTGGISRSLVETIINFDKDVKVKISSLYSPNLYARQSGLIWGNKPIDKFPFPRKLKFMIAANRTFTKYFANSGKFDVFHPTYYDPYFLEFIKIPFVLTVYDMIHEIFPEQYLNDKTSENKRLLCQKASKIIAISEQTKKDIVRFFDVPKDKIEVIHLASSIESVAEKETDLPKRFIFFVGSRNGYKNFLPFFESIKPILKKDKTLYLVCAGGGIFNKEENVAFAKSNLSDRVLQLSPGDEELAFIYKKALLFVYPSLYEGFGLPVLEAFFSRCPIAISDIPVFREIAANNAFYFDPKNSRSIRAFVENILNDDYYRTSKVKQAYHHAKQFSWQKTAIKTNKVYTGCLNSTGEINESKQ